MTRQYLVIYEWSGKNFGGYAPDIPGCMATAKKLPKMRLMLKEAFESHLQWMRDDGDAIPDASDEVTIDMKDDPEFQNPPGYYVVVESLQVTMPKKKRSATRNQATRGLELAGAAS